MEKFSKETTEAKQDLQKLESERKNLKVELNQSIVKITTLQSQLEDEIRQKNRHANGLTFMDERLTAEKEKQKMAEAKVQEWREKLDQEEKSKLALERIVELSKQEQETQEALMQDLEVQLNRAKEENVNLNLQLSQSAAKSRTLEVQSKTYRHLKQDLARKEKMIQDLEACIAQSQRSNSNSQQKELKKYKLKYEIMARNEINQKLAEINAFLGERSRDLAKNEKTRDEVMQKIQEDLGERLKQSRTELAAIKDQMKGKQSITLSITKLYDVYLFMQTLRRVSNSSRISCGIVNKSSCWRETCGANSSGISMRRNSTKSSWTNTPNPMPTFSLICHVVKLYFSWCQRAFASNKHE